MSPPKIFISATSGDLSSARQIAKEALLTINCHPVEQTNFEPDWRSVTDMLRGKISDCQALIHLVGYRYGAEPDPDSLPPGTPRRSYTQMEYHLARELGLRVYTFLLEETYPFDRSASTDTPEQTQLQADHRAFFTQGKPHIYERICSDLDLRTRIIALQEKAISLEHEQENISQEVKTTRHRGLWVAALVLLALGVIMWGAYEQNLKQSILVAQQEKMKEQQAELLKMKELQAELLKKINADPEYLRARLRKGVENRAQVAIEAAKLEAAKKKEPSWRKVDEIEKKRDAALNSIEVLLMTITNGLTGEPDPIFLEAAELLDSKGVEEALEYLQAKEPEINAKQSRLKTIKDEATRQHHESLRSSLLHGELLNITFSLDAALEKFKWVVQQAPEWCGPHNSLGVSLLELAKYEEAEKCLRDAVSLATTSDEKSTSVNNLGRLLHVTGRLEEAEPLLRQGLNIVEKNQGQDHPYVAILLNNLALLLCDTNRHAESEPLFRRALTIDEATSGPEHPNVASDLNNLAQLLKATNRLAEAEPLMQRALKIDEASFGPEHPNVGRDLNNLAQLLKATNRLPEAEPLIRRALMIDEARYGPQHPEVALIRSNLATLLQATNRLEEAESLLRQALKINEASYGPDHSNVAKDLSNLAALLQETNRLSEAELLLLRAIKIDEASYGPDHPNLAIRLNNLAVLYVATSRERKAETLMQRVVDIFAAFHRSAGHDHPNFRGAMHNYRRILGSLNLDEEQINTKLSDALGPELAPPFLAPSK